MDQPISNQYPQTQFNPNQPQMQPTSNSGMALASLIFGILGLLFFLPAFVAIILGHISLSKIKSSGGAIGGKGMAIAGLVMGYVGLFLVFAVAVLAAIASPIIIRQVAKSRATIAISNGKDIYIGLREYSFQRGVLPGEIGDGKSANVHLRVLFEEGVFVDETPFHVQGIPNFRMGDNDITGDRALSQGENVYAYIPGADIVNGLPSRPILATPLIEEGGRVVVDVASMGNQLVIVHLDGSISVADVTPNGTEAHYSNGSLAFKDGLVIYHDNNAQPLALPVCLPEPIR